MKLSKRIAKSSFIISLAAFLIAYYIRFVGWTTKWKVINGHILETHRDKPFIVAFWHGRILMIPYLVPRNATANVVISTHSDGELIARVQGYFGFDVIRGSSANKDKSKNKGGYSAIREMIRAKARGEVIVITPDGPRGPVRKVGGNAVEIAKKLELPIIPVTFSVTRCRIAKSWDSFMIAKPFGKGVFMVGEPIPPEHAEMLEERMNSLTDEADIAVTTL